MRKDIGLTEEKNHKLSSLGLIHTRHFDAQYCDIAIKRYCDKKIFLSHGLQD